MASTANGEFQGNVKIGELLVGLTSGAANVKDRRLLTKQIGNFKALSIFHLLKLTPTHVGQRYKDY